MSDEIDFAAHAAITTGTKEPIPWLERWSIGVHPSYTFADETKPVLYGEVYGDLRFEEGKKIVTSEIKSFCWDTQRATTRNTTYFLGEPCPVFLKMLIAQGKDVRDLDR